MATSVRTQGTTSAVARHCWQPRLAWLCCGTGSAGALSQSSAQQPHCSLVLVFGTQVEFSKLHPQWVFPAHYHEVHVQVDQHTCATLLMLETNAFVYTKARGKTAKYVPQPVLRPCCVPACLTRRACCLTQGQVTNTAAATACLAQATSGCKYMPVALLGGPSPSLQCWCAW